MTVPTDDLTQMTDPELAEWQANWKERTANEILAVREWERRQAVQLMREQFHLDQRLMDANVKATRNAAVLSFLGTLLSVALGANLTRLFG